MPSKEFKVNFARVFIRKTPVTLGVALADYMSENSLTACLPRIGVEGDDYQIRDMILTGRVWQGVFARLREDAPTFVDSNDEEHADDLEPGWRVVEKCHFVYHGTTNIIVWQNNRTGGSLNKLSLYLSELFGREVANVNYVMNTAELDDLLRQKIYELDFAYDRPAATPGKQPKWNKQTGDMMSDVNAAHAKMTMRAPRGGLLEGGVSRVIKGMFGAAGFKKIKVRVTADSDPIDLFMAPLKDRITVELEKGHPKKGDVHKALEAVYHQKLDDGAFNSTADESP